ncbi:uncharacterized protein EV154DRAFT_559389 [Mucor mucedo]|uniref:uncharacterized protein n=1 Tax=Mucor mucedo TaxID=29922 RepID=UPI00222061B3|nr:uncharacterized protein EV154DRAFT_559389 [Mucor mucedo]KAI7895285.1 hypothetical protein EV154DRAFT_559389 [Mucor mucedo]
MAVDHHNSGPHQATKYSPFSLVHGREARTLATPDFGVQTVPIQDYQVQTKDFLARALAVVQMENRRVQASNAIAYNSQRTAPTFEENDLVLVDCPVLSDASKGRAKKLVKKYRGPFQVQEVLSQDSYNVLEVSNQKLLKNVHAARLKVYHRNEDIAQPNHPDVVSPASDIQSITSIENNFFHQHY